MPKIILTGYMGAGKTTIGNLIAQKLDIPASDLDTVIEQRTDLPITDIFKQQGEIGFRRIEANVLRELLADPNPIVLSLGGGTSCYAENHKLLQDPAVLSVYLKASIPTLYNRLVSNKKDRPLLDNIADEELSEFIAKHLFERSYYYAQAQHTIAVDGLTPEQIAERIIALLA